MVNLTPQALKLLQKRYFLKDKNMHTIENFDDLIKRVANNVAKADLLYGSDVNLTFKEFFNMMHSLDFLPNSPTLMNAGTPLGQLSACFVIPVEDSLESIFQAIKEMVLLQQSGGGVGFNFSKIRPKGSIVKSTFGVASGPVSFIEAFDASANVIKQGGKRRGANMGILNVNHPDILDFIRAKRNRPDYLSNFNLSVAVTDEFMECVIKDKEYNLINPFNQEIVQKISAKKVFDEIVESAWTCGDPGLIFIDEINRKNPNKNLGKIECTNPCGEVPLFPYESCNLCSINLSNMVENKQINWEKLGKTIDIAIHFLDNVIDINKYPLPQIEKITKANRKVGLGVMGFADMLIKLGIKYNSEEGCLLGEKIMAFIEERSHKMSEQLGKLRGNFPNFEASEWAKKGFQYMRNATTTAIAPTGSISIIAGCSSGIEPLFSVVYQRKMFDEESYIYINPIFEEKAKEEKIYSKKLINEILTKGSLSKIGKIPKEIKELFVTAYEIDPKWHIKMQVAFQKHTDNSVSKTINLPNKASKKDIKEAFLLAYQLKCKGITIYRDKSKNKQVINVRKCKECIS